MSRMSEDHKQLINGKGRCSVPMWMGGLPSGFCDKPAFGFRPECEEVRMADGRMVRRDCRYNGSVPGLACSGHGGPRLIDVAHRGDPCIYCGTPHDEVEIGPCPEMVAQ